MKSDVVAFFDNLEELVTNAGMTVPPPVMRQQDEEPAKRKMFCHSKG
jgi:hypothetical protein